MGLWQEGQAFVLAKIHLLLSPSPFSFSRHASSSSHCEGGGTAGVGRRNENKLETYRVKQKDGSRQLGKLSSPVELALTSRGYHPGVCQLTF